MSNAIILAVAATTEATAAIAHMTVVIMNLLLNFGEIDCGGAGHSVRRTGSGIMLDCG